MYQNLANQNSLLNHFNGYMTQNPNTIPFQNNHLINNNVHVMNNLNDLIQQQRILQQNIPIYQQQMQQQQQQQIQQMQQPMTNTERRNKNSSKNKKGEFNIIKKMLEPQKIVKNNKDVGSNFKARAKVQEDSKDSKKIGIKMTNAPYKVIIKDKIINKDVDKVKKEDLVVHKTIHEIDANRKKFDRDLQMKENEGDKINDELKIEFHIDNYDRHKKKFEYKETFIKNLAFEENTFDENKQDYIDFYRQKQKEAEEGQKMCDEILLNFENEGIISKDELPSDIDSMSIDTQTELNDHYNLDSIDIDTDSNTIIDDNTSNNIKNTTSDKNNLSQIRKNTLQSNRQNNKSNSNTNQDMQNNSSVSQRTPRNTLANIKKNVSKNKNISNGSRKKIVRI